MGAAGVGRRLGAVGRRNGAERQHEAGDGQTAGERGAGGLKTGRGCAGTMGDMTRRLLMLGLLVLATGGLIDTLLFRGAPPLAVWTSAAVTALTAVILVEDLRRRLARPLRALVSATRQIAAGEFGH